MTQALSESSLAQLARTRGLKRGQIVWQPNGWLVQERSAAAAEGEPLTTHARWVGPSKCIAVAGKWRQRTEIFLPQATADEMLDGETNLELEHLLAELVDGLLSSEATTPALGWEPPSAQAIAAWLAAAGYAPAIDEDECVRFSLKARGSDGQVRVVRHHSRLRMTLALGQWSELAPASEQAMLRLAREANAGARLARIAWLADGAARLCEAQVDLSGLPVGDAGSAAHAGMWREMTRLGAAGLELALRRLGWELDLLADAEFAASLAEGELAGGGEPPADDASREHE